MNQSAILPKKKRQKLHKGKIVGSYSLPPFKGQSFNFHMAMVVDKFIFLAEIKKIRYENCRQTPLISWIKKWIERSKIQGLYDIRIF